MTLACLVCGRPLFPPKGHRVICAVCRRRGWRLSDDYLCECECGGGGPHPAVAVMTDRYYGTFAACAEWLARHGSR